MAGVQLLLAWSAVAAWFFLWRLVSSRTTGTKPSPTPLLPARRSIVPFSVEALLLVLFAALWFGSLGHGGWWVLFLVTGLLIELPARLKARAGDPDRAPLSWPNLTGALVRLLGAGALLDWLL